MKPHPRIRKTAKWGGAVVTVFVVVVWIGSGWWECWFRFAEHSTLGLGDGCIVAMSTRDRGLGGSGPKARCGMGRNPFGACFVSDFSSDALAYSFHVRWRPEHMSFGRAEFWLAPLWPLALSGAIAAAAAWRADCAANRRARLNLCFKCGYDRTGLPRGSGAKCPECGAAPAAR